MIICACVLPVPVAHAWTWPVDGPVLRPFSFDRAHPYAAGQHRGVDLGAASGTNVLTPAEGGVTFAGTVPTGGKTVSIETPFGYTATLVHLGSIGVTRGTHVTERAVVGTVGPSGVVDLAEPYVYLGLRVTGEDQGYVDPLTFLPARPSVGGPAAQPAPAVLPVVASAPDVAPAPAPAAAEPDAPAADIPAAPAVAESPKAAETVEAPAPAASAAAPAAVAVTKAELPLAATPEAAPAAAIGAAAAPGARVRSKRATTERPPTA